MNSTTKLSLTALAVSLALVGCGGGGGGGDVAAPPVNNTPTDGSIVLSVPAANYVAGVKRDAYEYLNSQRSACGFGMLQQAALVDTAAQGHADYLTVNGLAVGHFQNQTTFPTGFTGVAVDDRLTAAGYNWRNASEVVSMSEASFGTGAGQANIMNLFTGPYHGIGLLTGYRDVGFGFSTQGTPGTNRFVANLGATAERPMQKLGTEQLATYPCNGSTVLSKTYADEMPQPIAGRNLQSNPIGHPIYLKARDGQSLVVGSYDVRKVGTSSPLAVQVLNKANDTNGQFDDDSVAVLMPLSPLETNASYLVTAAGTNNGKAVSVSFTFNTGAF